MRLAGTKVNHDTLLKAAILDQINLLVWFQTEDGQNNRNRPESMVQALIAPEKKENDIVSFKSGEDFMKEWKRLTGGE